MLSETFRELSESFQKDFKIHKYVGTSERVQGFVLIIRRFCVAHSKCNALIIIQVFHVILHLFYVFFQLFRGKIHLCMPFYYASHVNLHAISAMHDYFN